MTFTIHTAPQGTPEWLAARAGRATGSRASDILAKIKSGEAAARRDYRVQLATERLTGQPQEAGFVSADMKWGTDQEPFARMAYEAHTGIIVRETGFLAHNTLAIGCSLDGDADNFAGIVEYKCPKSATHIKWLLAGVVPPDHVPQITHNLWVTGCKYADFVSFDSGGFTVNWSTADATARKEYYVAIGNQPEGGLLRQVRFSQSGINIYGARR